MFVKEVSNEYYGVYADEDFSIMVGVAQRVDREWYFQARGSFGGVWAFGQTLMDAMEQSGVLKKVQSAGGDVRRFVFKGDRKCRTLQ